MRLTSEQRASLEKSTSRYEKDVGRAAHYLAGRGLTEATARSFRLGVVHDPLPGDEAYRGRLCIPYLTRAGVVSVRYRCIERHDCDVHGGTKYLGRPGARTHLFNVGDLLLPGDLVCITEGELDAVILHQAGLPSVGVPGANNWKKHYSRIFEDHRRIICFADGDEAGRKFGKLVAEQAQGVVVVSMPEGMDVNDVYLDRRYGTDWLMSKVEG